MPNRRVTKLRHKIKHLYYGEKDQNVIPPQANFRTKWTNQIATYQKIEDTEYNIVANEVDDGKMKLN